MFSPQIVLHLSTHTPHIGHIASNPNTTQLVLTIQIPSGGTLACEPNKKSRIYVAAFSKPKDRRQLSLPTALKLSADRASGQTPTRENSNNRNRADRSSVLGK